MSIRAKATALARKSEALRKMMRKGIYVFQRLRFTIHGMGVKVDPYTVVFAAFDGRSFADSPKALYQYLLGDERFNDYRFIWLFREPEKYAFLTKNHNTEVVAFNSKAAERALARAKYWILNYKAPDGWFPRRSQVYLQCWHGIPLKKLGFDIDASDNAMNSVAEIQSKYRHDARRFSFLLSPCPFASDKFASAWNLSGKRKSSVILELGYPRNDFLVNFSSEEAAAIKTRLGLDQDPRKIILYAPTWRDNQFDPAVGYTFDCQIDFDLLQKKLADQYVILFRAHYLVASSFDFQKYKGFVINVSHIDDINELFVISDILVTDYSSVFFDFAILSRPILFFMPDLDAYRDQLRGLYLSLDDLPGPVFSSSRQLCDHLSALGAPGLNDRLLAFSRRFAPLADGLASSRVARFLFFDEKL